MSNEIFVSTTLYLLCCGLLNHTYRRSSVLVQALQEADRKTGLQAQEIY